MNFKILAVACLAIVVTLPPCSAVAQAPAPAAAISTADPADPPKKPLTRKESRAIQEKADARLCLGFPTEAMIIKCAEKYKLNKRET
jgi:hypothetical protein